MVSSSWHQSAAALAAMVALAVLDLAGAIAAKEAATRRSLAFAVLGGVLFVALFAVYVWSLRYAELSLVTLGWIVMLQIGVLTLDHVRYGLQLPLQAWAAVVLIIGAQAYLILTVPAPSA